MFSPARQDPDSFSFADKIHCTRVFRSNSFHCIFINVPTTKKKVDIGVIIHGWIDRATLFLCFFVSSKNIYWIRAMHPPPPYIKTRRPKHIFPPGNQIKVSFVLEFIWWGEFRQRTTLNSTIQKYTFVGNLSKKMWLACFYYLF